MDDFEKIDTLTEHYRTMIGMAGLVQGRGQDGFHEFDDWFLSISGQSKKG